MKTDAAGTPQSRSPKKRVCATALIALATIWSWAPAVAQDARAPEPVGSIPARMIAAGQSASLDLTPYFRDVDGDALAYAATVSDAAVAAVSVSDNILTVAGVAPGTVVVTVLASDPGGLAAIQRTEVTIEAPNRGPEPVGTIPGQFLAPGQRISISVSPYFSDPEGDVLSFSATTSDAAVAEVAVSGDVVTITRAGAGNAIVNAVARDPGGLSAVQGIPVAAGSGDQPALDPEPPGDEQPQRPPPEPARVPPAQPGPPAAGEAGPRAQEAARVQQPDPIFPPRLLTGFVEPTGTTLQRGRGWASAGYMGASPLAQVGDIDDVVPGLAQASYGVTDDLTVTAGAGYIYYNVGAGESDLFPYVAPKFRVYADERVSLAVAGYAGLFLAEETQTYYGGSAALSVAAAGGFRLHAAGGMLGVSATMLGETHTDRAGVAALGGDFLVTPWLRLASEYRRVAFEDGTSIVTATLGFVRAAIISEVGFAQYLEDEAEMRPIVSMAWRF